MDQVAEIREKIDIVGLIGEYVTVKKAGRNFKANCPFHGEKTPSFVISPERQLWHCFGCGKGGDAYSFLMEYEHMEFPEALRFLAKRAGVELVQSQRNSEAASKKEQIFKINALAMQYYHFILTKHPVGKEALDYLENREVNNGAIETFRIGFAPPHGTSLVEYLERKKQISKEDIILSGLGSWRGRQVVDFFAGRLMFPLIDHRDNIVGFSGRVLVDRENSPKYINTKETLAYHKSEQFFGINIAKEHLRKEEQAILVEGEFDVISCFQEGISNTLAIKGTALTEQQVNLLSRLVKKISICFDGDSAGQEAIVRSLPILEKKQMQVTVIVMPSGKDPDDAIKNDPYVFKAAIKNDVPVYDYLLGKTVSIFDKETAQGKKQIGERLLPLFARIDNQIVREHYVRRLSTFLDTSYESLLRELERVEQKEQAPLIAKLKEKRPREENLEEYLSALIFQSQNPFESLEIVKKGMGTMLKKERAQQKLLFSLSDFAQIVKDVFDASLFTKFLPTELLDTYNTSMLYPLTEFHDTSALHKEIIHVTRELHAILLKKDLQLVARQMKEAEKTGQTTDSLQESYALLLKELEKEHSKSK